MVRIPIRRVPGTWGLRLIRSRSRAWCRLRASCLRVGWSKIRSGLLVQQLERSISTTLIQPQAIDFGERMKCYTSWNMEHYLKGGRRWRILTLIWIPLKAPGGNKQKKSGTKTKTSYSFDFVNAPEKINWVLTDTSKESWTPFIGDEKVPESISGEWGAVFICHS